jgi:hypothetical protein
VGWVASVDGLAVNPAEVARVITAPLSLFCRAGSEKKWYSVTYQGATYETVAFEYGDHIIWGATARVIENFIDIVADNLCLP